MIILLLVYNPLKFFRDRSKYITDHLLVHNCGSVTVVYEGNIMTSPSGGEDNIRPPGGTLQTGMHVESRIWSQMKPVYIIILL